MGKPAAFVAYLRVSTVRQGESGLGLEAQRATVEAFARQHGGAIVASFVEVETGKRSDRPELAKALEAARKAKATLLIAKLDRLARNVAFIANLMDAGVEFLACDQPFASAASRSTSWQPSPRTRPAASASARRRPLQAAKARRPRSYGSPIAARTVAKAGRPARPTPRSRTRRRWRWSATSRRAVYIYRRRRRSNAFRADRFNIRDTFDSLWGRFALFVGVCEVAFGHKASLGIKLTERVRLSEVGNL